MVNKRLEVATILTEKQIEILEHHTRMNPCSMMIRLIVNMGLRHAEGLELRVQDYEADRQRVHIHGANSRAVPIPEQMRLPLAQTVHGRPETAYIVSNRIDGLRPLGARTFQAFLARTAEQLQIPELNSKNLRATCIVRKLAAGVEPEVIQRELGIRSRRSVTRYREEECDAILMRISETKLIFPRAMDVVLSGGEPADRAGAAIAQTK